MTACCSTARPAAGHQPRSPLPGVTHRSPSECYWSRSPPRASHRAPDRPAATRGTASAPPQTPTSAIRPSSRTPPTQRCRSPAAPPPAALPAPHRSTRPPASESPSPSACDQCQPSLSLRRRGSRGAEPRDSRAPASTPPSAQCSTPHPCANCPSHTRTPARSDWKRPYAPAPGTSRPEQRSLAESDTTR